MVSERRSHCIFVPVRREDDNLNHLSKLCEILTCILHLLQSVADRVGLVDDLENSISHRGFVEQIIDLRHGDEMLASVCEERELFSSRLGMKILSSIHLAGGGC